MMQWEKENKTEKIQQGKLPWTAARQASPSFTVSWILLKLMSIESLMLIASPVAIRRGEGAQRKRCRVPRCSPRGNPACRGTFGGRRKAVRDRLALQGGTGDFP